MSAPVSELVLGHGRPSLDTEAVSADEAAGEGFSGEIKVDHTMLDPSCLVPPTIPNTLGAEDIDKVIAALTNVPTMHGPPMGMEDGRSGRSRSRERRRRRHSSGPTPVVQARDGDRAENYGGDAEYDKMRRGGMPLARPVSDYDNDGGRRFMGRGGRGGLADLASGRNRQEPPDRFKGGWVAGSGRGGPVARGRNVFPAQEKRGKRVNNLFKRFQAQHRDKLGQPEGDLLHDGFDTVKSRREMREDRMRKTKTRSRTRSRSRGRRSRKRSASSSSDSDSSSSSDGSDSHKKKKKKIKKEKKDKKDKKDKKKKKKKDSGKKKKKDKDSSSESEEEKKGEGLDWRVDLLKKMKDIKNLPPEELEAEFKKAMMEKKRKEDEEKCLMAIKERQKMARRVKKQAEKLEKKEAKLKAKEEKDAEEEEPAGDGFYGGGGGGDGGFYNGFEDALGRMQSLEQNNELPDDAAKPFMSSFNEVPFVAEEGVVQGEEGGVEGEQGEQDPYARAQAEARRREQRGSVDQEMSWPAGAIENNMEGDTGMGEEVEMTKEMMDAEQEAMEQEANNLDDKTKDVVNTSKMFSKIRNRIKGKPLKIHLKSAKRSTEEADEGLGLEPVATPGEGLSGEEQEQFGEYEYGEFEGGGMEEEYDMRQEPGGRSARASGEREEEGDEEEERRVARYRERAERRRRERQEDREDGEHSPSPEPERPHHRRRRRRRHERREGTPVRDEGALEDGEVVEGGRRERRKRHRTPEGYQGPRDLGPPGSFPGSILGPPLGHGPPAAPPPFVPPPLSVDTSVPPPSLAGLGVIDKDRAGPIVGPGYGYGGPGHGPPREPLGHGPPRDQPPPFQQGIPAGGRGFGNRTSPTYRGPPQQTSPIYRGPPQATSPQYHGPPQPPSPNFRGPQHPAVQQGNHANQANHQPGPGFQHGPPAPQYRHQPPSPSYQAPAPEPRWDAYSGGRRAPPPDLRRSQPPEVKRENNVTFFDSLPTEAVDSAEEEEEAEVDITKVSPIMKYMAAKLVEQKYHLELAGPFAYRADTPGLSRHLFVAARMVALLEGAGYTGSKMYMSAMFPAGLQATKDELVGLVSGGALHAGIQGSRLVKMCVRCVRCFLAYYTGKSDDIDTSEGECSDSGEERGAMEEEGKQQTNKTVTTSLMDVLQRAKEEDGQEALKPEAAAPVAAGRYSAEDNPWQSMELGMRSEKLRSFTALQSHFTKQLVGRGVDQRDAREQAGDSMMCLVVADFNDASLRYMVERWKKVILPEQSQLEVSRARADQTLYDQLVTKLLKYQAEFPLSIIQEVQAEAEPQAALTRRVRSLVERVLKFYMRGVGREQQGKAEATTGLAAPADPAGLQFNYLPEGLREEEGAPDGQPNRNGSNFFNMDAAATANRQFSSYKRLSLDDSALEPVSPEHAAFAGPAAGKAATLPRQKYLFGTMYVDTLLYQGSSYVYEIGVHMADSSSIEVYIVPTKLFKQNSVLEMLGFSFNPDEKKYIYVKPGTGGFSKTFSEEHGLERVVQFLKEKRYESRGDSENRGLVLATQGVEDLATWVKFSSFHGKEWELRDVVSGYGCLDLWVEASGGACSYTGPRLHRENSGQGSTFFTWEYQKNGRHSDAMSAGKADALHTLLERLLDSTPDYDNFFRQHCFPLSSRQFGEVERRSEIIRDMYRLEFHLATSLNVRAEKRRLVTAGVFCPRTTAELGDRPGLVAARLVRLMAAAGLATPSLRSQILEAKDRGVPFTLPMAKIVGNLSNVEDRRKCESQIQIVTKYIEDYFLRRGE